MIHETAILRGLVTIAETAIVEPYAVITGPCVIGDRAYIGAHAVIGAPPQHHGTYPAPLDGKHAERGVFIGNDVCVREFVTIHQGLLRPTTIGADSLIMAGCHIAHDCVIGEAVTAGSVLVLGGFTFIDDEATFGQGCVTHPWTVIGKGAMVGLNSSVLSDVEPFAKVAGAPAKTIGQNEKKLLGIGVLSEEIWNAHSQLCAKRNLLKASWYA